MAGFERIPVPCPDTSLDSASGVAVHNFPDTFFVQRPLTNPLTAGDFS